MLRLSIDGGDLWDENAERFVEVDPVTLELEHSLRAIDEWESIWHVPFFRKEPMTTEQLYSYVQCMSKTDINPSVFLFLNDEHLSKLREYIDNPMTATTISRRGGKSNKASVVTSEVIFSNMIALNIPMECQDWHINKLLTLIEVCIIRNQPEDKMSQKETIEYHQSINERRRKELKSRKNNERGA